MADIHLTTAERIIIANQFQLIAQADGADAEHYNMSADILRSGYVGLYGHVFGNIDEEVPQSVTTEIHHILSMFRWIKNNLGTLNAEERGQLDLSALEFEGFDANNDPHFSQALFMVERLGLYVEQNPHDLNSHSQMSLPRYRQMLAVYNEIIAEGKHATLANFLRIQQT